MFIYQAGSIMPKTYFRASRGNDYPDETVGTNKVAILSASMSQMRKSSARASKNYLDGIPWLETICEIPKLCLPAFKMEDRSLRFRDWIFCLERKHTTPLPSEQTFLINSVEYVAKDKLLNSHCNYPISIEHVARKCLYKWVDFYSP